MNDEDDTSVSDEWLEIEPSVRLNQTAVVCPVCHSVNSARVHRPHGVFKFECPACRKKAAMRSIQARYRARVAAKKAEEVAGLTLALVTRLDRAAKKNQDKLDHLISRREVAGARRSAVRERAIAQRQRIAAFYKEVRVRMQADIARGKPRPFQFYMDGEQHGRLGSELCEPATDESASV